MENVAVIFAPAVWQRDDTTALFACRFAGCRQFRGGRRACGGRGRQRHGHNKRAARVCIRRERRLLGGCRQVLRRAQFNAGARNGKHCGDFLFRALRVHNGGGVLVRQTVAHRAERARLLLRRLPRIPIHIYRLLAVRISV